MAVFSFALEVVCSIILKASKGLYSICIECVALLGDEFGLARVIERVNVNF